MTRQIEENEFAKNWDTDPGPISQAVHEVFPEEDGQAQQQPTPAVNGAGDFPTDTPEHAAASKQRAATEHEAGRISADERKAIEAKADAALASK